MDKFWKELWIDALENGDYKQTTDAMYKYGEGYCCLGVLRHISTGVSNDTEAKKVGFPKINSFINKYYHHTSLTGKEKKYFDISTKHMNILIALNDVKRKTFKEIASWIRENL